MTQMADVRCHQWGVKAVVKINLLLVLVSSTEGCTACTLAVCCSTQTGIVSEPCMAHIMMQWSVWSKANNDAL